MDTWTTTTPMALYLSPAVQQAIGRFMARYSVGPQEALQLLRQAAVEHGRSLHELAREVATGPSQLPSGSVQLREWGLQRSGGC